MLLGAVCSAQEVGRGVGSWEKALGASGQGERCHEGDAVWARIPWRRPDPRPQERGIVVVESATGRTISNFSIVTVNSEYGDIVFQPASTGDYDIYYMLREARASQSRPEVAERTLGWEDERGRTVLAATGAGCRTAGADGV